SVAPPASFFDSDRGLGYRHRCDRGEQPSNGGVEGSRRSGATGAARVARVRPGRRLRNRGNHLGGCRLDNGATHGGRRGGSGHRGARPRASRDGTTVRRDRIEVKMAETLLDVRDLPKSRAYAELQAHATQVLAGIDDDVAAMATIASLLHHAFGFLWTGFYRVVSPGLLRVGPYQGTLGCLEIEFGRGVCGTAASERRTIVVPDVVQFA